MHEQSFEVINNWEDPDGEKFYVELRGHGTIWTDDKEEYDEVVRDGYLVVYINEKQYS